MVFGRDRTVALRRAPARRTRIPARRGSGSSPSCRHDRRPAARSPRRVGGAYRATTASPSLRFGLAGPARSAGPRGRAGPHVCASTSSRAAVRLRIGGGARRPALRRPSAHDRPVPGLPIAGDAERDRAGVRRRGELARRLRVGAPRRGLGVRRTASRCGCGRRGRRFGRPAGARTRARARRRSWPRASRQGRTTVVAWATPGRRGGVPAPYRGPRGDPRAGCGASARRRCSIPASMDPHAPDHVALAMARRRHGGARVVQRPRAGSASASSSRCRSRTRGQALGSGRSATLAASGGAGLVAPRADGARARDAGPTAVRAFAAPPDQQSGAPRGAAPRGSRRRSPRRRRLVTEREAGPGRGLRPAQRPPATVAGPPPSQPAGSDSSRARDSG